MAELAELWAKALPDIRNAVTGRGVWTALNASVPLSTEEGALVLGLPSNETELAGHLRMPQIRKVIEAEFLKHTGMNVNLRVIEGTKAEDWERMKRRDLEANRMQQAAMDRAKAEMSARTNWDSVYEVLSRNFSATQNKSLPQNRAKFYAESVKLVAQNRKDQVNRDDLNERNFARCIERLAQYADIPSTVVAVEVLRLAGEI